MDLERDIMKGKVGFAVIGCGMISRFHISAIRCVEAAELIGVFDQQQASAQRAALEYQAKAFASLDELLVCDGVDAVCILTPNGMHAPLALQALKAGKHVVIEKPMALSLADADAIIQAADQAKRLVCVISQLRFSPAVEAVKKALEQKQLGTVVSASLSMKYFRSEEYYASSGWRGTWAMDGGGALMNQGIHGVDLLQYLAGPVRKLNALCKTQTRPSETEDSAVAILEFTGGAVGTLEGSTTCCPGYPRRLEICGDRGSVVLQEEDILCWDLPGEPPALDAHNSHASSDPSAISFSGHERQLRNMVNAILYGEPLLVDAKEGRKPIEIILAVYQSSKTGEAITLE